MECGKPGQGQLIKKLTIRDIANAASVSVGTVSRVLNGHKSVSPENRRRVEAVILKFGYRPHPIAQSMRTNSTKMIGSLARNLTFPMMAGFINSAEPILNQAGYALVFANGNDSVEHELMIIEMFLRRRMDGLLMTLCDEGAPQLRKALKAVNVPMILLDRELDLDTDTVWIDHRGGSALATDYLLELGHRRIALLAGSMLVRPSRETEAGFRGAYAARGLIPAERLIVHSDFMAASAYRNTADLLAMGEPPSAIVIGGTMMLPGVLRAINEARLRIPEDVSIINGCDSDLAEFATPSITVMRKDFAGMGTVAAQLLLERLGETQAKKRKPHRIILPTELILRQSCAAPAVAGKIAATRRTSARRR